MITSSTSISGDDQEGFLSLYNNNLNSNNKLGLKLSNSCSLGGRRVQNM